MLLTTADVARLQEARPGEDFFFQADDGHLQLRTRPGQGDPCWFLAEGRCSVHDDRPEGCRLYPAILEADVILDEEHCPHTDAFRLPQATKDAVRRLVERLERERRDRESMPFSGPAGIQEP